MKNFKRIIALLICVIMFANLFVACGVTQNIANETQKAEENPTETPSGSGGNENETGGNGGGTQGGGTQDPSEPDDNTDPIEPADTLYTLMYKGGDGSTGMTPTAARAKAGEKVTVNANTFIKSGYVFVGWSDGTNTYVPGDEYTMPAKNVELTAQWELDTREQVTITFNTMGGSEIEPITVGKGEDTGNLMLPMSYKNGVVFEEWYTDEALTTSFLDSAETVTADITLYAGYFSIEKKGDTYLGTGETSLTSQDANTVILIDGFGVELTQDNYTDYITITNNYTIKDTPTITIEQSGDMYLLSADPAWPTGGNFTIEAKEPVKIITETEGEGGEMVELAVSKLFFTIHVGENNVDIEEKASIIYVERENYYAFIGDDLYLKTEFAFENEISKGRVLKVFDQYGAYEYVKVGDTATEDFGGMTSFVVRSIAPSLNDIYNNFKLSYTEANISSKDYLDTINEQEVIDTMTQGDGFKQFQNMTLAMVADYATEQGFANVSGIELVDGTMLMNEKASAGKSGHYNLIAVIYDQEYGINKEDGTIYGTWYILMRGVDQKAKVHVEFGMDSDMWISADGDCDLDVDVDIDWPWKDDFLDVDVDLDIWFDVYLGHSQSISFTFDIIYYNQGVEYDVRKQLGDSDIYDYPDNFAQKYKELINMGNRDVPIFGIDLFIFKITVLNIIDIKIPIGVELTMSVNGSFSVETYSYAKKYYGLKGDINEGFESYSGETYCYTKTSVYYNGTFGVQAGVYVAVDFSILGLGKIGSVGLEIGFGVYYDFYGYGYTSTWYKKESADSRFEVDAVETGGTDEAGVAYSEFGIYFKIGIYAKSDVFKVRVDAEHVFKIPLVKKGNQYLLLGFTDEIDEYARNGITFGDEGINVFDLGLHYYEYLDIRSGDVLVRMASNLPEDKPMTLQNVSRYGGEWAIQVMGYLEVDEETGTIKIAERLKGRRFETTIGLYGYIGGHRSEGSEIMRLIPMRYIPDSLGLDPDRLDETIHITFMVDDIVYLEMDMLYGYTLSQWKSRGNFPEYDTLYSDGADASFYEQYPEYANIRWKYNEFFVVLKEDKVFKATFNEKLVSITYRYCIGFGDNGPAYMSSQLFVPRHTWLYDALPELDDPGAKVIVDRDNPWSVENKQIDFADEGIIVNAQYEYLPITLTVNVDELDIDNLSRPAETYTYELTAGDTIWEYVRNHMAILYQLYSGYNPNAYGVYWTAYVKDEDVHATTKIWWNDEINIGWTTTDLYVEVHNHMGEAVVSKTVSALSDQSAIMDEEAVKSIPREYKDENGVTWKFKGWINKDKLNKVEGHVVVVPIYYKASHNVYLDPNGGRFELSLMLDENGRQVTEVISGDTFTLIDYYHKVVMDSTDTDVYSFNGWYYLDEGGEKVFEFKPVTEDIIYYADWVKSERTMDIITYSDGFSTGGTVYGGYEGDRDSVSYTLAYEEIKAIIEAIKAGDSSADGAIEIPTSEDGVFLKWSIVEFVDRRYELYPVYQMTATATVIVDIGQGRMYTVVEEGAEEYHTGTFTMSFTAGEYWSMEGWNGWQPAGVDVSTYYALNEETGEFEWISGGVCYEDEYYLYTFKGWKTSDGQTAWTFTPDQVVTITAEYERHYKQLVTTFTVDLEADDPEAIYDGVDHSLVWDSAKVYTYYGATLDPITFPVAEKTIGNDPYDYSLWEYVFDHWECVETGAPLVDLTVTGSRTYRAVFRKEYRQVTFTFDAGENAIFPSTNSRYYTVVVNRGTNFGTLIDTIETPVRTDGSTYVFSEWGGYSEVYDIMEALSPSEAIWWNPERGCVEGQEYMIQIMLDTGDDNAVFAHTGSRYYKIMFEPGEVLIDSLIWLDDIADNELPVGYLSNFEIIIDGESYVGIYEVECPFEMNMENDGAIFAVKELMTYEEWEQLLEDTYGGK